MYPLDRGMWGPTVRITNLRESLSSLVQLDVVDGYRGRRRLALVRYALRGRLRGLSGIYVENSSTLPSETDILFLALARLLGIPVLTYVRDAQYLFDEYYAATTLRRRVARALFLPSVSLLRFVSSRVAYPSAGLARAVRDRSGEPLLLPPGSPRPAAVPRFSGARALLFVGGMRYAAHGLDLLVDAVDRVRGSGHDVSVICVSLPGEEPPAPRPAWMRVERGFTADIHALLPEVLATIQPRLRTPYNDLAVPIKVMEYLSYARPLVVTDCAEQARIVREHGCGIVAADRVDDFAAGIASLYEAGPEQVDRWSDAAENAAVENSWDRRARAIVRIVIGDSAA